MHDEDPLLTRQCDHGATLLEDSEPLNCSCGVVPATPQKVQLNVDEEKTSPPWPCEELGLEQCDVVCGSAAVGCAGCEELGRRLAERDAQFEAQQIEIRLLQAELQKLRESRGRAASKGSATEPRSASPAVVASSSAIEEVDGPVVRRRRSLNVPRRMQSQGFTAVSSEGTKQRMARSLGPESCPSLSSPWTTNSEIRKVLEPTLRAANQQSRWRRCIQQCFHRDRG